MHRETKCVSAQLVVLEYVVRVVSAVTFRYVAIKIDERSDLAT